LAPESNLLTSPKERRIIFTVGVLSLIFVPIFKSITNLPPYMGILGALGLMWIITEVLHSKKEDKDTVSVLYALQKIDMPSILFFLGLLLSIGVLQHVGVLSALANWLDHNVGDINFVVMIIGVLSSIVDNVPLVAASMGMYSLDLFPVNHYFWLFLAYSAGTGGSILIIGSAAGVAAMGIEKINFFWYLKNASWLAFVGFLAGSATFILQAYLLGIG
jgi:Na+/H+ antiporter NhaD/arsenite permease-like protein